MYHRRLLLIVACLLFPAVPVSGQEPPDFQGVKPGISTLNEVFEKLGAPREIVETDGRPAYVFEYAPYDRVEVTIDQDRVDSIVLHLKAAQPAEQVAKQFSLTEVEPVNVSDEGGKPLGVAYPERGIVLPHAAGQPTGACRQVILSKLQPHSFVMRAKANLHRKCQASLADLEAALKLDSKHSAAHGLRAEILLETGKHKEAMTAIDEALRDEPKNPTFCLLRARALEDAGEFRQAIDQTRQAINHCEARHDLKARAHCQLGDQLASGPDRDYRGALEQHQQAIKLAQPLANDSRVAIRRAAKQVLLDAHLAVAQDIAWGSWNRKDEVAPKWLDKASTLATEMMASEGMGQELRFDVSRRALATLVGLQGKVDPAKWIEEASRTGQALVAAAKDPATRQQIEWALGTALYDALQIYLMVNQYDAALKYGTLALSLLESGSAVRQDQPGHDYMMGRFYFRLGSIEIALNHDSQAAGDWFKKAAPMLEKPIPNSAIGDIGRQGESLVAIGVTLWELNERDEALRLTERGLELMEKAVEQGILDAAALSAPYNNLAGMYRQMGNENLAKAYERLVR